MNYDTVYKIVLDGLAAHQIHSHRIAGDISTVIIHVLEEETAQQSVQRTGGTCPDCGSLLIDGMCVSALYTKPAHRK